MSDTNQSSNVLGFTNPAQGGSVDQLYLFFFLRLLDKFYDGIDPKNRNLIDVRVGVLVAMLPDKAAREGIWKEYLAMKEADPDNVTNAAIYTIGSCVEYLATVMDLTKVSWMGFV
jgi:hypothetical protein